MSATPRTELDLTDLPRMDQSLLWAIRTWVLGRRLGEDMGAKIEAVFRHIGVADASHPLEGFLWVLSQGLTRSLQVNCTCQTAVSPDETRLLAVFEWLAEDKPDEAETMLSDMANERAALLALDCALRVVLQFRAGGHGSAPVERATGKVVSLAQARMVH
ncbi:hypothetical protein NFI95_02365 [Acetobacteraceae bacterium KSS8]|uniref:Uncharacterized protein n=1 Tax=Endosaccharibacter trunci TaxID=2812733 RepID=A0ABT1W645_9PROT|nr:hypothetical protein [Acetobacteraceae bacterium KSS8]